MLNFEISNSDLKKLLAEDGEPCVLLDVRELWEYDTARIEGSTLMPMGDVPSRAHNELNPDAHIITICHHGVRSMSVTAWLRNEGFERAQSLRGGIDAWSAQVDGLIPRY